MALAITATVMAVQPGSAAAAGAVALWPMTEGTGTVMVDAQGPTSENGDIGPLVALTGSSYDFPGWRNNVTSAGRLQGSVSASGGLVSVPDPNDVFDPNPGFSVIAKMQASLTAQGRLPTKAAKGATPSFNVVQKGRADSPGGFWKMEIAGSGQLIGKIRCVARDGQRSKVAVSAARIDDGALHTVGCELSGGKLTAIVDGGRTSVAASTLGPIHPSGKWATSLWIGKKPGSTDPADAFAGTLRDLTVSIL